ncbi:DUF4012 domain-containing protein [Microbacterium rhizosphaerae]|uniref:DUF4012 domain-containing protein n=1 Tax=Microbacterium rhizosphaerae TaxID=1678237 RepID=A0ABZ0SPZ6_9MICO|nr:DUF4012 domain-containing protein [Microbacterium rhizosphaerae]WPR90540.1 DUF4012 domain-containing protein [Microbacterium rhizosphaerae]
MSSENGRAATGDSPRRHRRRWPWILLGCFVLLLGIAAASGFATYQLYKQAKTVEADLSTAKHELGLLSVQVSTGDQAGIQASSERALAATTHANQTVQGRLWAIGAYVPFIGQNVAAVRDATEATDILVRDAVPVGVRLLTNLRPEKIKLAGGGIDLAPFQAAMKDLPSLNAAFAEAQQKVAGIDRKALLPIVDQAIGQLLTVIDQTAPTLQRVQSVMPTLLKIAGGDGPRHYLLIFQNNAEIRATGGNPAVSMVVTVDNGRVTFDSQANSTTFASAGRNAQFASLPAETLALYLKTVNRNSQDFTMTPDFPTTAQLFENLWQQTSGTRPDGVVSVDPVVFAEMLSVAGPFRAGDGTEIGADNAVKALLSDAYARYPTGPESNAFFADVASRGFLHLTTPTWDPMKMLAVLQKAAGEQRVYLAFSRADEQAMAVEYGLDGALRADNKTKTQLGIYLNDYSVGKLEYYLKTSVSAACDVGKRTATVTMTLASSVPSSPLDYYVLGLRNGSYGLSGRDMMIDVLFFAPPGAKIVATTPSTGDVKSLNRAGVEKGNTAISRTIALRQGHTRTVAYTVQLPEGPLGALELRHTPTVTDTPVTIDANCGALMGSASK